MIPWRELDRATIPGGTKPLILSQRDTEFAIRLGSVMLMGSDFHGSEEALAERVCDQIAPRATVRVLIGGLGMGFTLAAALSRLRPDARVVVAELIPAVVRWNRGPLADLAGRPLEDPRVTVIERDVAESMRLTEGFDAIILDVDNGPNGLTREANDGLYSSSGLAKAFAALREAGVLGVWSVAPDHAFSRRLGAAGFVVEEHRVRARGKKGTRHTLWIGLKAMRESPRR